MSEARDVEAMNLEELRAEVWYWREEAAADLAFRVSEYQRGGSGAFRTRQALRDRIRCLAEQLEGALGHDLFQACEACGEAVKPGQAVISDADGGELHATCMGAPSGCQPGDKLFVDPAAIVWEGEGPKPDHIVAHASSRLYDLAGLREEIGKAFAALAGAKAA